MRSKIQILFLSAFAVYALSSFLMPNVRAIDSNQIKSLVASGQAVLIDVREKGELNAGRLQSAFWMPTSEVGIASPKWEALLSALKGDAQGRPKKALVYCRSGKRAERVAELLRKSGFTAENLGGFETLKSQGLPVTH